MNTMITARQSLLCDFVQQATAGKVNLLGVFQVFNVAEDVGVLPAFYLYTQLVADDPNELAPGKATFGLEMIHKDGGNPIFVLETETQGVEVPVVRPDMKLGMMIVLQLAGLEYKQLGLHFIKIKVNGKEVDEIRVRIDKQAEVAQA